MRVRLRVVGDQLFVSSGADERPFPLAPQLVDAEAILSSGVRPPWLEQALARYRWPKERDQFMWVTAFGRWVYDEVYRHAAEGLAPGERLFVDCADSGAAALPLEAAVEPGVQWPVAIAPGRPTLIRTCTGALRDRPAWPPGVALRVLLANAVGEKAFPDEHLQAIRGAVQSVGGDVRLTAIEEPGHLEEALTWGPSVVHLIAHGRSGGSWVELGPAGPGVPIERLAGWIADAGVRIVVLNVCEAGAPQLSGGLAALLVRRGVPVVVAARHQVDASAMAAFAHGFFASMATGAPLDECVRGGRRMMTATAVNPLHHAVLSMYASVTDLSLPPSFGSGSLTPVALRLMEVIATSAVGLPFVNLAPLPTDSPAALLRPGSRAMPFVGREHELAQLDEWRDGTRPVSVAAVVGEGGSGKTRLAMELVERSTALGWVAGFVARSRGAPEADRIVAQPGERLVVIDYAETTPAFVTGLLERALSAAARPGRLRVLLLLRQRPLRGDWLASFRTSEESSELVDAVLAPSTVPVLELSAQPLSPDERERLATKAAEEFTHRLRSMGLEVRPTSEAPRLDSPSVLVLGARVLLGLLGDDAESDPFGRVLDHERRYWSATFPAGNSTLIDRVVALTVLAGIGTEARLAELLQVVPDLADASLERRNRIARWCASLAVAGSLLQPDRLAETHVGAVVADAPVVLADLLDAATDPELAIALTVLSRSSASGRLPDPAGPVIDRRLASWISRALRSTEVMIAVSALVAATPPVDPSTALASLDGLPRPIVAATAELAIALVHLHWQRCRDALGAVHPATLRALDDLEPVHRAAMEALGSSHPGSVRSLRKLAGVYETVGRAVEALPLFEEAYRRSVEVFGGTHPDTLTALDNLAAAYRAVGRDRDAVPLLEACLGQRTDVLGIRHPATLAALNNLASVYQSLGRVEEAATLLEACLGQRTDVLGVRHPATLAALDNLASVYQSLGRVEKAATLLEACYGLRVEVLGDHHPDTLASLNNLAVAYQAIGRAGDAVPLLEACHRQYVDLVGERHPATVAALGNLASAYRAVGRPFDALPAAEQCYQLSVEVFGERHPDTLRALNTLASTYESVGRVHDAVPLFERSHQQRVAVLGERHPDTLRALNNLAFAYRSMGRLADAAPLFERCYQQMREVLGEDHPATLTSFENLAAVRDALAHEPTREVTSE